MSSVTLQPLAEINQHRLALLFAQYLRSQDISAKVVEHEENFIVLCDRDKVEQAKDLFEQFIENPNDEKYQQIAWHAAESVDVKQTAGNQISSFRKEFLAHAGAVTLAVFAICWLVFIGSSLGWASDLFFKLRFFAHLSLDNLFSEPIRLIGPAFFHFSLLHIAFNTIIWWRFGGAIEAIMGKWELVQLFLFASVLSNLGQFLVSGPNFGGLSGVVYAVVGYVWWASWLAPEKGLIISKPTIGFLLVWLLLGFIELLPINMANTAHSVGLISGCLLAWLKFAKRKTQG